MKVSFLLVILMALLAEHTLDMKQCTEVKAVG